MILKNALIILSPTGEAQIDFDRDQVSGNLILSSRLHAREDLEATVRKWLADAEASASDPGGNPLNDKP